MMTESDKNILVLL